VVGVHGIGVDAPHQLEEEELAALEEFADLSDASDAFPCCAGGPGFARAGIYSLPTVGRIVRDVLLRQWF